MNLLTISFAFLRTRLSNNLLNLAIFTAGIILITILVNISVQTKTRLTNDVKGFDAVLAAKGSPLQSVLSSIWHVDIPTGNINYNEAKILLDRSKIKRYIPISLGDNFKGFRIVGSEILYIKHFKAQYNEGGNWSDDYQVVIGAEVAKITKLKLGDKFSGVHGLVESFNSHDDSKYEVVGILKPNNSVIDKLIITSLASVWDVHDHEHHEDHDDEHEEEHEYHADHDQHEEVNIHDNEISDDKEVTAFLIKYNHRISAISFPRYVNKNSNFLAASPAFELAKISKFIGIGEKTLLYFGAFLIIIALISMLIGLLNTVNQRKYDLAIFRTLGASRKTIFLIVIIEGMIISLLSISLGIFFGNIAIELFALYSNFGDKIGLESFVYIQELYQIILVILILAFFICLIPARKAYKTDILHMLTHE